MQKPVLNISYSIAVNYYFRLPQYFLHWTGKDEKAVYLYPNYMIKALDVLWWMKALLKMKYQNSGMHLFYRCPMYCSLCICLLLFTGNNLIFR